jgi:hypothetical protein
MRAPYNRSVRGAPYPILFVNVCCTGLAVLLSSCGAGLPLQREAQQAKGGVPETPYSIVCVIHGDGDYLYHDTSGTTYTADEEALAGAQTVALQNPLAEVFIFHQRPRRHLLFIFPLRDGDFYYYRNGRLIAQESYWRDQKQLPFGPEAVLYHHFRAPLLRSMVTLFLYCGHEIPEFGGVGYDASYRDRPFTVQDFAAGLRGFTGDSARFDLMVLSTCFGGTPYTIGTLESLARYVIASPENLHLSYFDLHLMERLDLSLRPGDVPAFANRFAHEAFTRLSQNIQTAVSVAVYDVDRVQEYVHSVIGVYDHTLTGLKARIQGSMATIEHCDCADIPQYVLPAMSQGVDVLFRPARFGRSAQKQTHSGWECWGGGAPKDTTLQISGSDSE